MLKVVTYNVLSAALCTTDYYGLGAEICDQANRFPRVCEKLDKWVKDGGTIICLQEVALDWSGRLHTYFAKKGYYFIVSNYGSRSNGYMGVGIAFPLSEYTLEDSSIKVIADTKNGGWKPVYKNWKQKLWGTVLDWYHWLRRKDPNQAWHEARKRFNHMVSVKLSQGKHTFWVSTYHMPCLWWIPESILIHTALCLEEVHTQAGELPYILCGDFNFSPTSEAYHYVTGSFKRVPTLSPPPYCCTPFQFSDSTGMSSAYSEAMWKGRDHAFPADRETPRPFEPEYTHYTKTKPMKEPFKATLDYVFSRNINTRAVQAYVDKKRLQHDLLPSLEEPSDHLAVVARFNLDAINRC